MPKLTKSKFKLWVYLTFALWKYFWPPLYIRFYSSRDLSVHKKTDGQTNMAKSTQVVFLIKNIFELLGQKSFIISVKYLSRTIFSFTLRATGLKRKIYFLNFYITWKLPAPTFLALFLYSACWQAVLLSFS